MSPPFGSDRSASQGNRSPMALVRHWRFGLGIVAEILLLAALNRYDDWHYESMPIRFVETALFAGVAFFVVASLFAKLPRRRGAMAIFWIVAVALRIVVLPLEPSDDFWRYQWEGKVQNAGFNPYVLTPNDEQLVPLRAQFADWNRINHRQFSAIYPPGVELIFAGLSKVSAPAFVYKLLFA